MSYVRPDCPLPRNSSNPVTDCEAARAKQVVTNMERLVSNAYQASQGVIAPESLASFGAPAVQSARQAQSHMPAAKTNTMPVARPADAWIEVTRAPMVYPLNVSVAEYDSCCDRGTDALQPVIAQTPQLQMPPKAPSLDLARSDGRPAAFVHAPMAVKYDSIVPRGMGAIWGDAGMRCPQVRYQAGVNWRAVAIFGAAVLGVVAFTRR